MFITLDLLKERKACKEGILFFQKYYPNGADTLTLLSDERLPKDFFHWAYLHIGYDNDQELAKQERQAFEQILDIHNSTQIFNSQQVKDSDNISKSIKVEHSQYVYQGVDIQNSHHITNSKRVTNSDNIFSSKFVTNSHIVIDSKNVTDSTNVYEGTFVIRSSNIFKGNLITDCNGLRDCTDLSDSAYCTSCKRLRHCLFCDNLTDKEYYIFNQKCSEAQFAIAQQQFNEFAPTTLYYIDKQSEDDYVWSKPHICYNYSKHYSVISHTDVFWEWIKSLPGYDPKILYTITFNPILLKD